MMDIIFDKLQLHDDNLNSKNTCVVDEYEEIPCNETDDDFLGFETDDDVLGFETDDEADSFVKIEENVDKIPIFRRSEPKEPKIDQLIKHNVLPFLPAKILARFKSVSKEWDTWIKSPAFMLHHSYSFSQLSGFFCQSPERSHTFMSLDHMSYGVCSSTLTMLPESVTIKSSSGGLLLCQGDDSTYYICNPATKAWKVLPKPVLDHDYDSSVVLVFEPSKSNIEGSYQVVCAVRARDQNLIYFEVYSSVTRSWRPSINAFSVEVGRASFTGCGFYTNGMAYWGTSSRRVLVYSVENDTESIMLLPPTSPQKGVLTVMQQELCYVGMSRLSVNEYSIEIYSGTPLGLKRSIDVHLEVDSLEGYCVMSCCEEKVLILVESFIYSYRLSGGTVELIGKAEAGSTTGCVVRYLPYVNSLVNVH